MPNKTSDEFDPQSIGKAYSPLIGNQSRLHVPIVLLHFLSCWLLSNNLQIHVVYPPAIHADKKSRDECGEFIKNGLRIIRIIIREAENANEGTEEEGRIQK